MHGKDTWASLKPINPKQRTRTIKWYSYQWVKINERIYRAFDNHSPDLRLSVKYEDLKNNTLSELRKIYDFLKIEITDNQLEEIINKHDFKKIPEKDKGQGKFFRSASPGSWQKNFSKEEQDLMNSIMKKTLDELNYII